jgi:putative nucleotidyltransferase with HDIG domain
MGTMSWKAIHTKSWEELWQTFAWIQDMEGVPQDPEHHAEGDVAIHTKMVWEALQNLSSYQALDSKDQQTLCAAALLHDVEKRSTTRTDAAGRITARGHARKGARTARRLIFRGGEIPFQEREQIAGLVKYHGLPVWLLEKRDAPHRLFRVAASVNTRWLGMLVRADLLGRICADQSELLDRLDLFEEYCRENDCWGNPKAFASSFGQYHYLQGGGDDPNYAPYEADSFPVIMLSGLPGMGKDTLIRERFGAWPLVSLDTLRRNHRVRPGDKKGHGRVIQEAQELASQYLRSKTPFVWNATNLTATLRAKLVDRFQTYGAKTRIVYVETNYREWIRRNREREHSLPEKVLFRMLERWEVPEVWEAPEVEYIVQD